MILRFTRSTFEKKPEKRNLDVIKFDIDNMYPFHSLNIVQNCGILESCTNILGKFIFGGGFATAIWKQKVGKLRTDQFFRAIINQYKVHKGFAFWVGYNALFDKIQLDIVPFDRLRLKYPDEQGNINKIVYCENWYAKKGVYEKRYYDIFTTDKEITARQVEYAGGFDNWNGQIFYYGENGLLEYPTNTFHSVLEDAITLIQCKLGRNSLSSTNFVANTIIELPFKFNQPATEYEDDPKELFMEQIEELQGYENSGNVMVVENPTRTTDGKTNPLNIHKLELTNHDTAREKIELAAENQIIKKYNIPEIFLKSVPSGFSTRLIQDYYNYYNEMTKEERQIFEELAAVILPDFFGMQDFTIIPLSYIGGTNG